MSSGEDLKKTQITGKRCLKQTKHKLFHLFFNDVYGYLKVYIHSSLCYKIRISFNSKIKEFFA